jgi:hypothetical protein
MAIEGSQPEYFSEGVIRADERKKVLDCIERQFGTESRDIVSNSLPMLPEAWVKHAKLAPIGPLEPPSWDFLRRVADYHDTHIVSIAGAIKAVQAQDAQGGGQLPAKEITEAMERLRLQEIDRTYKGG